MVAGVQYKIAVVIAQVAGYALSKFIGIRFVSSLRPEQRGLALLSLAGIAALSLLGFAVSPPFFGLFWMFLNGLPLGMAWGLVFGYLEGRRVTEALAALLCINFIVSSGFVKTVGKYLLVAWQVPEFWMPFLTGMLFLPVLVFCIWYLEHLPPPSAEDEAARSPRSAMSAEQRRALFIRYWPGLLLLVGCYLALTMVRDVRDNFAVELWAELGWGQKASILTTAEIPIALLVLAGVGALSWVKDNLRALWFYHLAMLAGAMLMWGATILFQQGCLSAVYWMVLSGVGIIFPYILFNGAIFDRLMATFQEKGNVGFLMYIADATGYLGSVAVLLWRNFGVKELSWVRFFEQLCLYGAVLLAVLGLLSWRYFRSKK